LAMTQQYLGHASPETTMIYVHIANEQMKKAHASAFD
jgi:site-specific recombinase XerD